MTLIKLDNIPEDMQFMEWRLATYYYKPIVPWLISENGILINYKTGELKYGHDNVKGKDKHLRVGIKSKLYYISRIVAEAFVINDNIEKNIVVRHLDDDPHNNHYSNLKWGTHQENTFDGIRNKKIVYDDNRKYTKCENHPQAKLTNDDVRNITKLLDNTVPIKEIAEIYDVDIDVIRHIYKGKSWLPITKDHLPFPVQFIYNPLSDDIKSDIREYLLNDIGAKPSKIIKDLNLEYSNQVKSCIYFIRSKLLN